MLRDLVDVVDDVVGDISGGDGDTDTDRAGAVAVAHGRDSFLPKHISTITSTATRDAVAASVEHTHHSKDARAIGGGVFGNEPLHMILHVVSSYAVFSFSFLLSMNDLICDD